MLVSESIKKQMEETGWIRKMFEEGINMKKIHGDMNVFDFSLGNPFIEPPEQLIRTIIDTLNDPVPGMHRYMPNNGYEEVREEIAVYLKDFYNMPFTSDHVYMTAGSAGGINILLKSMLNPGDEVIVPTPYFMEYRYYIESHGGVIRLASTDEDFQLDIEKINSTITPKTKAILINSPNNPTGVVYEEERLRELASLLSEYRKRGQKIYIISDDAYRKLVFDNIKLPNIFKIYDLVISATSHSKDLALPGERIGYITISPMIKDAQPLIDAAIFANRILGFINAPATMQRLVKDFQKNSVDIEDYQKKRDAIYNMLTDLGYEAVKPLGAFYIFPKSPIEDDIEFIKHLQRYHILAVPGAGFGRRGYFRLAYCVEMDVIERSASYFKEAIRDIRQ